MWIINEIAFADAVYFVVDGLDLNLPVVLVVEVEIIGAFLHLVDFVFVDGLELASLLGIEVARFEATPLELTGINKFDGTYATITYAELNRTLTPSLNWDILQQTCTAELPTGSEKARLVYQLGEKTIELIIDYTPRRLDVPVRVSHQNLSRYKKIDISKWL